MFKKGIGYLLLCCFLNVLTTLPAKCCEAGGLLHHSKTTTARSFTVIQYLFDMIGDGSSEAGSAGVDVHCSVFNIVHKQTVIQSAQFFRKAGSTGITQAFAAPINYTGYNARRFSLPQHHNFLFRLTPF